MTFTEDTKANICEILKDKRVDFLKTTKNLVENEQKSYYRLGLKNIYFGDIHTLQNIIEETILTETNPSYNSEIVYHLKGLKDIEYEEVENYYKREFPKIEAECKCEFWLIPENQQNFESLSNFKAFKDIIIERSEIQKYGKYLVVFSSENWQGFHKSLIALFLPDFKFESKLSSKLHRYIKPISDNLFIAIEHDFRLEHQSLSRGNLNEFGKYKIVLLNRDFDRKTKREEYLYKTNGTILKLGDAFHPIFKEPCTELFRFFAKENIVERANGVVFQYQTKYEYLPDDKIRLYNSEEFGFNLKKHAFFYMDIFTFYLKQYLNFLEDCISMIDFNTNKNGS